MIDSTSLQIWTIPTTSYRLDVEKLEDIISKIPKHFIVTIDDFEYLFWEINWENEKIDFFRDYKGD